MGKKKIEKEETQVKEPKKVEEPAVTKAQSLAQYLISMRNDARAIYQEYRSRPKRTKRVKTRIEEAYFKGILYACDASIEFIKKLTTEEKKEADNGNDNKEVQN